MGASLVVGGSILLQGDSLVFFPEVTTAEGERWSVPVGRVVVPQNRVRDGIEAIGNRVAAALAYSFNPTWGSYAEFNPPMPSLGVLRDHNGGDVSLDSLLENGPAVILFYRGYW